MLRVFVRLSCLEKLFIQSTSPVMGAEKLELPLLPGGVYTVNEAVEVSESNGRKSSSRFQKIGFGRAHVLITAVLGSAYVRNPEPLLNSWKPKLNQNCPVAFSNFLDGGCHGSHAPFSPATLSRLRMGNHASATGSNNSFSRRRASKVEELP